MEGLREYTKTQVGGQKYVRQAGRLVGRKHLPTGQACKAKEAAPLNRPFSAFRGRLEGGRARKKTSPRHAVVASSCIPQNKKENR